jgi:hypothetical protein
MNLMNTPECGYKSGVFFCVSFLSTSFLSFFALIYGDTKQTNHKHKKRLISEFRSVGEDTQPRREWYFFQTETTVFTVLNSTKLKAV